MERLIESTSIVERNAQSLGTRWRSIPLLALLLLPASPGLPLAGCGEQTGPEQAAAPLPGSGELAVLRQAISPGWYVTWPDEDPRDGKPDDKEPPGWFNGDEKILVVLVLEENCVSEMTVRFGEDLCGDVRATMTREGGYFVWSAQCSVSGKTSFHQNWAIPVRYTGTLQCPVGPTTHPALANVDNPGPIITSANYTLTGGRSPYPTGCTSGTSCYFTTGDAITASWNAAADGNVICPEPPQRNPGGCIENVKFDFGSFGGGLVTVESAVNGVFSTTYRVAADGYYRGRVRLYAYKAYSGYSANRSSSYTHYDTKVTTINPKFFTITGGTGTNKAFKKDDIITITWNDGPNGNNNGDDYYYKLVNLSAIGGSASKTLTALGDGIFQTTH
ncbi:MAG: hypothetical protein FJ125_10105, partial [Deltaproteobacteria bacterium]|nr:hypothetical protein [Deltaproteobacteria bacterium]